MISSAALEMAQKQHLSLAKAQMALLRDHLGFAKKQQFLSVS